MTASTTSADAHAGEHEHVEGPAAHHQQPDPAGRAAPAARSAASSDRDAQQQAAAAEVVEATTPSADHADAEDREQRPLPTDPAAADGRPVVDRRGLAHASRGRRPAASARSALSTTLSSSIARVIGPTPPGIGATKPATSRTSGRDVADQAGLGPGDADVEHGGARAHHVGA